MHINTIYKIIEGLAQCRKYFCSKADFQNAFSSQLQITASAYQVHLGVQPVGSRPTIIDIWGRTQDRSIAVELRYPTAEQEVEFINTQEIASFDNYTVETAKSEFCEAVKNIEWLSAARMVHKGFAIFLTNQPKLWEEEFSQQDWRDYLSLNYGRNPHFRYFVIEVENFPPEKYKP